MFAFVSAFPKSLHCTDEAQQAETVLSAVLNIYIYILNEMRKKYIENIVGASSVRREKNASTRTRTEILQLTRLIALPLSY